MLFLIAVTPSNPSNCC